MPKIFKSFCYTACLLVGVVAFLPSCNVAKHLPEGDSLLKGNKITIADKKAMPINERDKVKTDLVNITAQKPNKSFLGFMPFKMWIYYSATKPKKKLNKFRQWLIDKVGEPPVVYDSTLAQKSSQLMENYMFNYGYFYAHVTDTAITKNRRTKVTYSITPGPSWKIGDVTYPLSAFKTDTFVYNTKASTKLKTGERFDIANLKAERERIESVLRNSGFYYFNREYVTFNLDTTTNPQHVNIKVIINQPSDTSQHKQYRINNFYVVTDFATDLTYDTLRRDTVITGDSSEFHILAQKTVVRKNILRDVIFFRRGWLYNRDRETRTLIRLSQLGVFKFISMDFNKSKTRPGDYLDCFINLTPAKRQEWGASGDVNISNEGLFGTSLSLSYKNKNISKRADKFLVDVSTGVQVKFSKKENVQIITSNLNVSTTYYLNRFLLPFRKRILLNRNINPLTRFTATYNFEDRYDFDTLGNVTFLYQLHNFNLSFGYEWTRNPIMRHVLNPATVTFYLLPKQGSEFVRRLNLNPILKSSFEEQVIIGPNYTFIYDPYQRGITARHYMYFRTSVETAGNIIYAGFKAANNHSANDSLYYIFKKPFSQYFRVEADWRNYIKIRNHGMFAIRTYAGIGVPYGNSYALPFIKQFSVGGPNSLRGFLIREVGPGGYVDTSAYNVETGQKSNVGFFNQTGDIKLEMNAEFRFDIYKWLKGAVFMDAGNVWTVRKDTRENGSFAFDRFWKEFAVDAGAGIRLDFNFFVIRFDYGFPLRDPRKNESNRWLFQNAQFRKGQFQLAINYPF